MIIEQNRCASTIYNTLLSFQRTVDLAKSNLLCVRLPHGTCNRCEQKEVVKQWWRSQDFCCDFVAKASKCGLDLKNPSRIDQRLNP